MKLLINLSMLGPRPTGLGVYTIRCAQAACDAFAADVIAPASYAGPGSIVQRSPDDIVLGGGRTARVKRWFWARRFRQPDATLLYSPTHQGFSSAGSQILTVHDLTSIHYPETNRVQSVFFKYVLPRRLVACSSVFTVSETTKRDIHQTYRVPLEKIRVIPNGVDRSVFKPSESAVRENFLLVVGASVSHKNVEELIARASLWRHRYRLVIVSSHGKYRKKLAGLIAHAGLEPSVHFMIYASLDELVRLYQTCAAFVSPSKWEGFGIPPLEALACGAPVIVSDIPAHREVLGAAAHFVTLGDETSWGEAFAALERPPITASPNPAAGPLEKYTWVNSANALVGALLAIEPSLVRQ